DGGSVLSTFSRDAGSGELTFTGCIGQLAGCATTSPAGAVEAPISVTVSPDGTSVYAVSVDSNTVDLFVRSLATCSDITAAVPFATATTLALTCSDLDGDPLTYAIVSPPSHGTFVSVGAGGQVAYTPAAGFSGADS